jgi:hypothetical protein
VGGAGVGKYPQRGSKTQLFGEGRQDRPENVGDKLSLLSVPRLMRGRGQHWRRIGAVSLKPFCNRRGAMA